MNIELKQAAQQVLKELGEARKIVRASSSRQLAKDWDRRATDALANLRTAIQQAQQPVTGEPVVSRNPFASRCYTMSESHLSGHRLIVGFEKLVDAQDAHEWVTRQGRGDFTHPAPSVPDGWVLMPRELTPDEAMRGQGALLDMCWDATTCFVARYAELIRATEPRRTAIQQAEAQQPATGEPVMDVRCEGCGYMTHHREHMGCVRAAKQHTHPAPSVPDGYVLVPIEPTQAMMNVQTWDFSSFYSPREIWAAMLAAK